MPTELFFKPGAGRRLRRASNTRAAQLDHLYGPLYSSMDISPRAITSPVISGTNTVGSTLTVTPGIYVGTPIPTVTRQWQADGVLIPSAVGLTYVVAAGDAGKAITCQESASNVDGTVIVVSNAITIAVAEVEMEEE